MVSANLPSVLSLDPRPRLRALTPRRREAITAALVSSGAVLVSVAGYLAYKWSGGLYHGNAVFGRDFVNYWTGAVLARDGRLAEIFNPLAYHAAQQGLFGLKLVDRMWSYPPHTLLFVYPLGFLPYVWAYAAWTAGGLAAYLWAALGKAWRSPAGLALALAPATVQNIYDGQNGFWTAALFVAAFRLADRRSILAGICLGCLTFKPQLGLLIPIALIAGAQWRTFIAATLATAAVVGASLLVHGVDAWRAYFDVVAPHQMALMERSNGLFILLMPSAFMSARALGLDAAVAYALQAPFTLFAIGLVVWAFRARIDRDLKLMTLLAAAFLCSPYTFIYDMTLMSVAVMLAVARAVEHGHAPWEGWVLAAVWFMPIFVKPMNYFAPFTAPALVALMAVVCVRRIQAASPSVATAPYSPLPLWERGDPPRSGGG